jgi:mono/diheme cytochrome c family protein
MMGRQATPASFVNYGERIYFTGTSASGRPIAFSGGNMHMQMHGGGCVTCHDVDRQGGIRVMPRFWVVAPPITSEALFGEHDAEADGHGDHTSYTEASLQRAITEGIDPSGQPFDEAMPPWSMSAADLDDLVHYLQGSRAEPHSHTTMSQTQ